MEESIREAFSLDAPRALQLPNLTLAYVGDAFYELVIRTVLTEREGGKNGALHRMALPAVSAVGQARIADGIRPLLSEEEAAVYRRGKNAKPEHIPKGASLEEYHKATGLETLLGFLYFTGREDRALELIKEGLPYAGDRDN